MASAATKHDSSYTLYYDLPSLCSQMVRFTWALRNKAIQDKISIKLQRINIMKSEQLEKNFLLHVNWKGQVPVLISDLPGSKPLPESVAITEFIMDTCPELKGAVEHEEEIIKMIHQLHDLNFYAISFLDKPKVTYGFQDDIKARMAEPSTSEDYRQALQQKWDLWQTENVKPLETTNLTQNDSAARSLFQKLEQIIMRTASPDSPRSWLYGSMPTALDAHLTVLLARLEDVNRLDLAPPALVTYKDWVTKERSEWLEMMDGGRTMPAED